MKFTWSTWAWTRPPASPARTDTRRARARALADTSKRVAGDVAGLSLEPLGAKYSDTGAEYEHVSLKVDAQTRVAQGNGIHTPDPGGYPKWTVRVGAGIRVGF